MGTARPVPSPLRTPVPARSRPGERDGHRSSGYGSPVAVAAAGPIESCEDHGPLSAGNAGASWSGCACTASSAARRSSSSVTRTRFVAAIPTAMRARARAVVFSRPRPTSRRPSGRAAASRRRGPRTRTRGPSTPGPGSRVNGQRKGQRAECAPCRARGLSWARSPAHATVALDRLRLMVSDEPPLDDDPAELLAPRGAGPWRSPRATRGHAPGTRLSGMRAVVRARPAVAERDAAESPVPGSAGPTPCSPRSANTDATRTSGSPVRATKGDPRALHRRPDVRFLISFVRPATGGERTFHMRPHTRGHRTRNN
jgi:hypothetical protein